MHPFALSLSNGERKITYSTSASVALSLSKGERRVLAARSWFDKPVLSEVAGLATNANDSSR
jgi:hypothetical protein